MAYHFPATYFLSDPKRSKSLALIPPTKTCDDYGAGILQTTLPTIPNWHPVIFIYFDPLTSTWLARNFQHKPT
jgi:hypothetical protein